MKLYRILFNEQNSNFTNYNPPTFALIDWRNGEDNGFALFHVENFKKWIENGKVDPFESWLCAFAEINNKHDSDCSKAVEVNYMVRSPVWKGAGSAMYALVSNYFSAPITSDRKNSTSNSAKKAWANIESDSNWKKVYLDNWFKHDKEKKTWYQFKGSWPNRTVYKSDKPSTPDTSDDCSLPGASSRQKEIDPILGTADAWIYQGSLNSQQFLHHGNEALKEIAKKNDLFESDLKDIIESFADKLFTKYYTGK